MKQIFKDIAHNPVFPGALLTLATILALVCSNTGLAEYYEMFLSVKIQVLVGKIGLSKPALLWINDGLMALFFLMVGLELKREMVEGELSKLSQVALPVVAAIGGMAVPALVYVFFNHNDPTGLHGWAIPSATDIAFSLGVLAMLGTRVPLSLKLFLTTLAIIDDLGAIIIIAIFYTDDLSMMSLIMAALFILILILINRMKVTNPTPYLLFGLCLWLAVLKSGVHATLAGVFLAFCIPMRDEDTGHSPVVNLEKALHTPVSFLILPIFAFANAGLSLDGFFSAESWNNISLGILFGLFLGKPLGVFGFSAILILLGFAKLPKGASWGSMLGVGMLCGIGFTMSLFIGSLAFDNNAGADRLGILTGSGLSALLGLLWLHLTLPKGDAQTS